MYNDNSVKNAVWIGTALLSYGKYLYLKQNNKEISESDFWFSQKELVNFSQKLSKNIIHSPRVQQWYNGDHENCTYNFLRANGTLRRLSGNGEFFENKEIPTDLDLTQWYEFKYEDIKVAISIADLIKWRNIIYSEILISE